MTDPAPPFKWAGGKTRLLPAILARLPAHVDGVYHEPFVGGGAVFFALAAAGRLAPVERLEPRPAILSDVNRELTTTYRAIRDRPDALITALDRLRTAPDFNTAAAYYAVRSEAPGFHDPTTAARFLYLNKLGFNGLYRVNAKGGFNVPFGKYDNPTLYDRDRLFACAAALRGASINDLSFRDSLRAVRSGDVVYLDPPYLPTSPTANFAAYDKGGFTLQDQKDLAAEAARCAALGATVWLSQADTPLARSLYVAPEVAAVHTVSTSRSISCKASTRGAITELLVEFRAN